VDRDLLRGDQIAPRATAGRGRLLVDQRGEPQIAPLGDERGDQLAGIGLHAADLAGDEVDEVQRDVHEAGSVGAATTWTRVRNLA